MLRKGPQKVWYSQHYSRVVPHVICQCIRQLGPSWIRRRFGYQNRTEGWNLPVLTDSMLVGSMPTTTGFWF